MKRAQRGIETWALNNQRWINATDKSSNAFAFSSHFAIGQLVCPKESFWLSPAAGKFGSCYATQVKGMGFPGSRMACAGGVATLILQRFATIITRCLTSLLP